MADFSGPEFTKIKTWVEAGCICTATHLVYRYQAAYPNTLCVLFEQPTIIDIAHNWAGLDIHYTGTGAFQALGGFWIRGINGKVVKPEQHCQSPLRRNMYNLLKAKGPAQFPDIANMLTYAAQLTTLEQLYP